MTDRKLFEAWASKQTQWDLFWSDNFQSYMDHQTNAAWLAWQASANREGYKLVPVETLEEALSWANCASNESWNEEQREEIDKHYRVIEKAMIGVVE